MIGERAINRTTTNWKIMIGKARLQQKWTEDPRSVPTTFKSREPEYFCQGVFLSYKERSVLGRKLTVCGTEESGLETLPWNVSRW